MAEFTNEHSYASKGVANAGLATGIVGSVLGVLGGGLSMLGGNGLVGTKCFEQAYATQHDIDDVRTIASKDAEIARLNAKIYSDESDLAVYKQVQGEINALKEQMNAKWTDQAVVNAVTSNNISTLNNQVLNMNNILGQITKTAVPSSAICNFGNGCGCSQM